MSVMTKKCNLGSYHVVGYRCDYCNKRCNLGKIGNAIYLNLPYPDKYEGDYHFCSRKCLIRFLEKIEKEGKDE